MRLWSPLLLAGAMIVGTGFAAPAFAHHCNGFSGFNGCNGFSGFNGFNGHGFVAVREPVFGFRTRLVPVNRGFVGFNGCNGFSGFSGFSGFNGFNGCNGFFGR
jgi:hypothetical protein